MSDDTARVLGAAAGTATINGKEIEIRPLSITELAAIEKASLKSWKEQYLETQWTAVKLMFDSDSDRQNEFRKIATEVAKWTLENVPHQKTTDWRSLQLTDKLKNWLFESFDVLDRKMSDTELLNTIAPLIDDGVLSLARYRELINDPEAKPRSIEIPFAAYWPTGTLEGKLEMIFQCVKSQGVTREELATAMRSDPSLGMLASRIESSTSPDMGNT